MKNSIRIVSLIMVCISLSAFGQNGNYNNKTERDAIKCAARLLAAYYPPDELCVSDSIYDLDWFYFADVVDDKTKQEISNYRTEKKYIWSPPIYSHNMAELFGTHNCECTSYKYVAQFSAPYNNLIRCDILPGDRRIGIYGSPTITSFLFIFNNQGEVDQMFRDELHID